MSLLEAFRYAVVETKRVYETDTRLQTEHAQLDDMGTKTGVDRSGRPDRPRRARSPVLPRRRHRARPAANDPQLAAMYKDKFALEDQIDQLRIEEDVDDAGRVRRRARDAARAARAKGEVDSRDRGAREGEQNHDARVAYPRRVAARDCFRRALASVRAQDVDGARSLRTPASTRKRLPR